ncbi:MAG: PcfK-like family protein [Clostridia bacterium]|nr:PcfK-like family protein [Clostridia bacterium]
MKALNLIANGNEQTRIKDYLQNNVSDQLAQKINNGVEITKDGKQLINKKDLDGFMSYACDEAKKQASANARFACVDDATVFGWAIHYFEEDSIEGKLFNLDGSEYIVAKPKTATTKPKTVEQKPKVVEPPKPAQHSIFDLFNTTAKEEKPTEEFIDKTTGEVFTPPPVQDECIGIIQQILGNMLEVKI